MQVYLLLWEYVHLQDYNSCKITFLVMKRSLLYLIMEPGNQQTHGFIFLPSYDQCYQDSK